MATISQSFLPGQAALPASAFAIPKKINGTNNSFHVLQFDAATDYFAYFKFPATAYGSGNLTIKVFWYADTASSGDVIFGAAIGVITPNTDTQDIETDALATASTATDSHLGTTNKRLHRADITVSNLDSLAANDDVVLQLYRDANAGGDTLTGYANVTMVVVEYSDT